MKIQIDFGEPIIPAAIAQQILPSNLNDFYCTASDFDKSNIFFMLLTSLHHYKDQKEAELAARLSYLIACYLFVTLTPPGSAQLALHYITKAIALHPCDEYMEWLMLIKKGN